MTSGTESDDSGTTKCNNKVVRFNKVAEVIKIILYTMYYILSIQIDYFCFILNKFQNIVNYFLECYLPLKTFFISYLILCIMCVYNYTILGPKIIITFLFIIFIILKLENTAPKIDLSQYITF